MFGSLYFGQTYFGGTLIQEPTEGDRCGGMFGTATFGQSYFGQHIQCPTLPPPIPPVPPTPVPVVGFTGGTGTLRGFDINVLRQQRIKELLEQQKLLQEKDRLRQLAEMQDEEDIKLLLSLWMSIK